VEIVTSGGPKGCSDPGRYTFKVDGQRVAFTLQSDACEPRRMILDRSTWTPAGAPAAVVARRIVRTAGADGRLPPAASAAGSWPSFRGAQASGVASGQDLPDRWNAATGESILWRAPLPGLAHSSPVVWGDRVYVTTAVSSDRKRRSAAACTATAMRRPTGPAIAGC